VLWWLPPLMLQWANSHGGAIDGFLPLGIEIAGLLLHALSYLAFPWLSEKTRPLLIVGLLCLVAATVNPQGPRLLLFPFQTLGSRAQQDMIAEGASPRCTRRPFRRQPSPICTNMSPLARYSTDMRRAAICSGSCSPR